MGVDCTSAIPAVFTGTASVTVTEGKNVVSQLSLPMSFESAFLNPFGGPIVMASDGREIFVIATYTQARVTWTGIQLGGVASGHLAGNPVSGMFAMNVAATEDLRGGYELDSGTITFFGMSDASLNATGSFNGRSTIPPGVPCPTNDQLPPGTCQLTGFNSNGVFTQHAATGGSIVGKYSTVWIVPAVAFTAQVTASVK